MTKSVISTLLTRAGAGFCPVLLIAVACATEPLEYSLPERNRSLDPKALVEPQVLFMCGKWVDGAAPSDAKIFVDVAFVRRSLDEPANHPTQADMNAVKRHGGQIAYKFHVRAVRAWIATSDIPGLEKERDVNLIFRVSDPSRYDWITGIGYRKPYTIAEGATRVRELGGRVDYTYNSINALSGLMPDESIATMMGDRFVDYIEGEEGFPNCF